MAESSRIRDPVHNFIALREIEVKLLATPAVQRLRGIRQLAMANLVYPGALHSRFDHSLGVCHVAGLMAERLDLNPDHAELVRLAALLHDLGHGPFSHVSEYALERYANREAIPADQKKEKIHELVTAHIIEHDSDIARYLSEDTRSRIVRLLAKGHGPPILRSIVSGPLDADKQDYLLRDSHFCGVQYGVFDIHQLHRSMVNVGHDDEQELMIDPDGVHALEQFVMAKYYLTTNVYRHRVRLVTDQMIVRAIVLGIEVDQLEDLRAIYTFDNSEAFFRRYTALDDARFMFQFDSSAKQGTRCGDLLARLQRRQLHKRVFTARIEEFDDPQLRPALQDISKPSSAPLRKCVEEKLSGVLGEQFQRTIDPHEVIVHGFDIKSVRTTSRNDEGAIMIDRRPQPVPFDQDSTLFASIDEGYAEASIEVYAPVAWETPTERGRFLKAIREPIQEAISAAVKEAIQTGDDS
jgi:HD superfamily phosphohydrolase